MLSRFRSNPELVDESWRTYFNELLGDGAASGQASSSTTLDTAPSENGGAGATPTRVAAAEATAPAKAVSVPEAPKPAPAISDDVEIVPIRGAALKIVENMEAS